MRNFSKKEKKRGKCAIDYWVIFLNTGNLTHAQFIVENFAE
jgi:hypothetical protein